MKVLAVVPARGGSKGIPLKNVAVVAGRPLLEWTLSAARECPLIGLTLVSTDHAAIAECAERAGAVVVHRPQELAQDTTPTAPVLQHAWEQAQSSGYVADVVMTLQPTSPLRESHHLTQAIELFSRHPDADSLVSVQEVPHQFGPDALMRVDGDWGFAMTESPTLRRQEKGRYWARNGAAVYMTRAHLLQKFVWGGKTLVLPMDKISSLDVDDPDDLYMADALLRARQAKLRSQK